MKEEDVKILILEDEELDRELIRRTVTKAFPNAAFIFASTKKEFIEKLSWSTPDIILSDYHIPGYNGLEALLHTKETIPYVPFVFVTGILNNEEKAAEVILQGAAAYVLKKNLSSLPELLATIYQKSKALKSQKETLQKKENKKRLLIQKLEALIEQSSDFDNKEAILDIFRRLRELH